MDRPGAGAGRGRCVGPGCSLGLGFLSRIWRRHHWPHKRLGPADGPAFGEFPRTGDVRPGNAVRRSTRLNARVDSPTAAGDYKNNGCRGCSPQPSARQSRCRGPGKNASPARGANQTCLDTILQPLRSGKTRNQTQRFLCFTSTGIVRKSILIYVIHGKLPLAMPPTSNF